MCPWERAGNCTVGGKNTGNSSSIEVYGALKRERESEASSNVNVRRTLDGSHSVPKQH